MKKIIPVFLLLGLLVVVVSCKKIIKALFPGFDIELSTITLTLPAIPFAPPSEVHIATFNQHFNLDSIVKAQTGGKFGTADVGSIKVKEIIFTLSNPDQQNNLANFESARFTLSSSSNSQPAEIAAIHFPDQYAETYTFTADPSTPDLISYLQGTELTYDVYGKLRRITTKPLTITLKVTVRFS